MADLKTTEAQRRASRNYDKRNPEKTKVENYRRSARTFFRHHATQDDIDDLIDIFKRENPNGEKMKEGM